MLSLRFSLGPGNLPVRTLGAWLLVALCLLGMGRVATGALVPAKAVVAQMLLERAFDRSVALHRPQKPWPWADMALAARIKVPRIGVARIVLDTGSGQAMAFGPTLLPGSAKPGEAGVSVIAAHRDTHFRFLQTIRIGDTVEIESTDGVLHRYRVSGSEIVRWDHFAVRTGGPGNELALSTCYPFGAIGHGPLRYVVWAQPMPLR